LNQVLKTPEWYSFHFHHEIIKKEHRDNCPSCSSAFAGMNLYVELCKESEVKTEWFYVKFVKEMDVINAIEMIQCICKQNINMFAMVVLQGVFTD